MKNNYLTLAALAATLAFTSCKKDADFTGDNLPKVTYSIQCPQCVVELETKSGKKKFTIKGSDEIITNTKKTVLNATATGTDYINLSVSYNDQHIYSSSKNFKETSKVIYTINTQVK